MANERVIRLEVPSQEALDRLFAAVRNHGSERQPRMVAYRDIYFDTPGRELGRRGAEIRLRHHQDGRVTLRIDVRDTSDEQPPARHRAMAEVESTDPDLVFQGESEPARLLRALVDPARLEPAFELETLRRSLPELPAGEASVDIAFDTLTVRRGGLTGTLREVVLRSPRDADLGSMIGVLEGEPGVRITLSEPARRARELLDEAEISSLEREVRRAREVALLAVRRGKMALLRTAEGARMPVGDGSGESAARRVAARYLPGPPPRLRLLGVNAGGPGRPALEVWVAEESAGWDKAEDIDWVPFEEAIEAAGAGGLREPRTLATLEVAARSDLGAPTTGPGIGPDAGSDALEFAVPPADFDNLPDKDLPPEHLLNAELSRIAFDERILVFAESEEAPLLERIRFLSMFAARQDDFFMSRVAGFKEELAAGGRRRTLDGLTAQEQLDLIGIRARQVYGRAQRLLRNSLLPALEEEGIRILRWDDLDDDERAFLRDHYGTDAEAVLTPMASDASHPFPHIRNLRPALGAVVRLPSSERSHFTAIELPGELPRFLPLPDGRRFVPLEELLLSQLAELFAGLTVESAHLFRVTRSAKTQIEETLVGDVLQAVEEDVARRPFRPAIRLEVDAEMPGPIRDLILRELRYESVTEPAYVGPQDVYEVEGFLDLAAVRELAEVDGEGLRFEPIEHRDPWDPSIPVFDLLAERDRLVYFPVDSFETTAERFVREAAEDPDVVAVKVTLYRTDASSAIVRALARARELGKDAVALIEIKASFDEQRNIAWAKSLSAAGIHVVFSPLRYKVHAKAGLVVRREGNRLVRYCYIGTGNLNNTTARSYTDVALLTADPEIGEELQGVFNILTGYSGPPEFEHLLVSPFNMRHRFLELIDREIEHAKAGREAGIRGQLNGLADRRLIAKLYEASQEGVRIELAAREICALRPGVPGLSENIRIVSLLGRLLQHARIFEFTNGGEPEYIIGSADWRPRNLSKRVEVAVPIRDPELQARLHEILDQVLQSPDLWELRPDGSHVRRGERVGGRAAIARGSLAPAGSERFD